MQSDTALQVVAFLQEAGILTPAAADAALQKIVSHCGQAAGWGGVGARLCGYHLG